MRLQRLEQVRDLRRPCGTPVLRARSVPTSENARISFLIPEKAIMRGS